MKYQLH